MDKQAAKKVRPAKRLALFSVIFELFLHFFASTKPTAFCVNQADCGRMSANMIRF
jgi:hypothetical protein